MPSGKFYAGTLSASTNQDTGEVPAGKVRTVTIGCRNKGSGTAIVNLYIATSTTPTDADGIHEVDIAIPAKGVFKLSGEVVGAGERVIVNSSIAGVSVRVSGFEENA